MVLVIRIIIRDDGAFVMAGWLAVRVEWSEEE